MSKLLQLFSIAIIALYFGQSEAVPASVCSPVLPPPIPECRIASISGSRSRQLEEYIKGNITAAQRHLMDIFNISSCHPDYLSINQSERVLGINPAVMHSDSTSLGKAINYLRNCFYPVLRRLEDSETLRHMDGGVPHLDTPIRGAVEHIASAVSPLKTLVRSDPRLTPGIECQIPQVQCLPQSQIHGTAGQIRFYELWVTAKSTWNYLGDLLRVDYWTLNN